MKSVAMSGSLRANVGKKDAKALRRQGMVPCVLYGGKEQVMFGVDERAFKHLVYTPDVATVDLSIDGKAYKAILKELQTHPVTDSIIHADFIEILTGKNVTMSIPVKFNGNAVGVRDGGRLLRKMRKLTVSGPIEKMPQDITIQVADMKIGDSVRVSDMKIDGLTFLDKPNMTIVAVRVTRNVVEEEVKPAAGAAAAPAAGAAAATPAAPAAGADAKKPAADAKKK
ncbi:MAG TPA: 50S ribosomal protein L25/general stress protein Ctc [Bacteroidia bacterium]|jgi:large subunit ribosomal protein L25|nr:50S ribosomal protein L25/general stress protein Ctc [Bacteroidia bacterium]